MSSFQIGPIIPRVIVANFAAGVVCLLLVAWGAWTLWTGGGR